MGATAPQRRATPPDMRTAHSPPVAAARHGSTSAGRAHAHAIFIPSYFFPFRVFRVFRGYIRIHLRQGDELIQPPVGHHGVVVQKNQVVSPAPPSGLG